MYQPVVLYISIRYVYRYAVYCFEDFVSSWLSIIGISLGVTSLIVVLSVMNGFEHELEKNILGLIPQALLTNSEERLNPENTPPPTLNALPGVSLITTLTTSDVVLQSNQNIAMGVMLGINPTDPEPLSHYLMDNANQKDLIAGQYRIILGYKLANALDVKRGDIVRLIMPNISQFTPVGQLLNQRLFTVIGFFSTKSNVDSYQLLVNQRDASRLMLYPDGYITGWRLWLKQPIEIEKLLRNKSLPDGFVLHDWRERNGELFQAVHMEKKVMSLLFSLIIIVSVFNVISSLGLLIMEKQAEVAILRTQGLSSRQVMLIFMIQGAIGGIVGASFGASVGVLLAKYLNKLAFLVPKLLFNNIVLPVSIDSLQVINIIQLTMILTLLSTIYPSWCAAIASPAKVLRYE
ncbi:lipoprotein-releasing ABC transporter permease subunit LolC [Sodalis sp. CWE]|uniref:lipoprotein-releasing ABC transporter permease subunit LolC n=1 Tax=Sodalis sp. CWE TaxID=2803816 RepID=UPI001C7D31A8|nr:lipoprotein-releasing ABC transporter permease subunit LolC [Sodalis sp. CWE]MBX4181054.1 lipoprotein-releasing ABC transporter permease subunit LolC [Sodalis sp. CWE]